MTAFAESRAVITNSLSYLSTSEETTENVFDLDDARLNENTRLKGNNQIIVLSQEKPEQKVVLFNSNLNKRHEVVSFRVNSPFVIVYDSDGKIVENIQVSLIWPFMEGSSELSEQFDTYRKATANSEPNIFTTRFNDDVYELLFEANFDGLSMKTFLIRLKPDQNQKDANVTKVTFYVSNLMLETSEHVKNRLKDQ